MVVAAIFIDILSPHNGIVNRGAHYRHYHRYSLDHKDPAARERYYHPLIGR